MKPYRAIAEYYDAENADHRVLEQDVPFFLGQLPKRRGRASSNSPSAPAGRRSRWRRRGTAWSASITPTTCSPSPAASATRSG